MFVRRKFLGNWEKWLRIRIITSQSAFLDWENSQSFRKNYRGCHLCKKNFKKMFVRRGYRRVEYDITGQEMAKRKNTLKAINELTLKQKAFVDIYVENWGEITKVEAAKRAGYKSVKPEGPTEIASRLTDPNKNPHVVRYMEMKYNQELKKYSGDKLKKYKNFERLSKEAEKKKQFGHAINAEYRSGQMAGFFIDKKEVTHVGLEGMSREELEKRLSELEGKIGEAKDIIDVTPEKAVE